MREEQDFRAPGINPRAPPPLQRVWYTPEDALLFYNNIRDLIRVVCFLARASFGLGVGGDTLAHVNPAGPARVFCGSLAISLLQRLKLPSKSPTTVTRVVRDY